MEVSTRTKSPGIFGYSKNHDEGDSTHRRHSMLSRPKEMQGMIHTCRARQSGSPLSKKNKLTRRYRRRYQDLKKGPDPLGQLLRRTRPPPRSVNVQDRQVEVKCQKVHLRSIHHNAKIRPPQRHRTRGQMKKIQCFEVYIIRRMYVFFFTRNKNR